MKIRSAAIPASAMLAAAAALENKDAWLSPGSLLGNSPPPMFDNRSAEIFRQAAASPNATRSITFRPFEGLSGTGVEVGLDEWTWRVNVTEFGLPHLASNFSAVDITDPSFITTSYDLTWPRGSNVSAALRDSNTPFCITTLDVLFPANVTNLYTDENTNSTDCEHILGEECLNKLYFEGNNLDGDRCSSPSPPWNEIPECSSTFGAAARANLLGKGFTFGLATTDINPESQTTTLNDTQPILSGEGLWTFESGVVDGANATQGYLNATNRLQVFMFNTWHDIQNGRVSKPNVLCMRVNTTTLPTNSSATSSQCRMTAVVAAVLVTIFALLS